MSNGTRFLVIGGLILWSGTATAQLGGKKAVRPTAVAHISSTRAASFVPTGSARGNPVPTIPVPGAPKVPRAFSPVSAPREDNRPAEYGSGGANKVLGNLGDSTRYVSVPDNPSLVQSHGGTIEMWVYASTPYRTTEQELIVKGKGQNPEFMLGILNHQLCFRLNNQTATNGDGTLIPAGAWTHVAVTWTGGALYTINFFVDGAASGMAQTLTSVWAANSDSLLIGAEGYRGWPTDESFNGMIDEVRIWNVALQQQQIATNRFVGLGDGPLANENSALTFSSAYAGLSASWTFNAGGTAFDDIGQNNGYYRGGAGAIAALAGQPMPYNFALDLPGEDSATVYVPTSTGFDQTANGTVEMWIKPGNVANEPVLISKGSTLPASFVWGIRATDSTQFLLIGATEFTDSMKLTMDVWSHIAVTWRNGPNFIVTFYLDGRQGRADTSAAAWNINTDPVIIGGDVIPFFTYEAFTGYLDEVRFWKRALTASELQHDMFASCRALTGDPDLLGAWNFDGNLNNFGNLPNVNGSFNNGWLANNARISGYLKESSPGPEGGFLGSHSTVLSWVPGGPEGVWPDQFTVKALFAPIYDNDTSGTISRITVAGPGTVGSVTVFLSLDHTFISDVVARVTAPNGQTRRLLENNGGGENALTFFDDSFGTMATDLSYFAPWGYLRPIDTFGNFGGSTVGGTWTLKVFDDVANDSGVVKGWGLRFYNTLGVGDEKNTLPAKFDLAQNYPNPFNPSTTIFFSIPRETNVRLVVYNLLGQEVATLVNETMKPGNHAVSFDAGHLASGTYFYRLTAGSYTAARKMLLLK